MPFVRFTVTLGVTDVTLNGKRRVFGVMRVKGILVDASTVKALHRIMVVTEMPVMTTNDFLKWNRLQIEIDVLIDIRVYPRVSMPV